MLIVLLPILLFSSAVWGNNAGENVYVQAETAPLREINTPLNKQSDDNEKKIEIARNKANTYLLESRIIGGICIGSIVVTASTLIAAFSLPAGPEISPHGLNLFIAGMTFSFVSLVTAIASVALYVASADKMDEVINLENKQKIGFTPFLSPVFSSNLQQKLTVTGGILGLQGTF